MACIRIPNGFVCVADAVNQCIEVHGRKRYFDFSKWGGPLWTDKVGNVLKNQTPSAATWEAFDVWMKKYKGESKGDGTEQGISHE